MLDFYEGYFLAEMLYLIDYEEILRKYYEFVD